LGDVSTNSREILADLLGGEPGEGVGLQLELAFLSHDMGKWVGVDDIRGYAADEQLADQLGLSSEERHILELGIQDTGDKGADFSRQDIAHHLFSALVFTAETQEDGVLAGLDPQDVQVVRNAILEHQFAGYYRGSARSQKDADGKKLYSEAEIDAIRRKPKLAEKSEDRIRQASAADKISAALHDGDKVAMCEVGRVDEQGQVHYGGYAKVIQIRAKLEFWGKNPESIDPFDSANASVEQVGEELVTEKAKKMRQESIGGIDAFTAKMRELGFYRDLAAEEGSFEEKMEKVNRTMKQAIRDIVGNRT